MISVRHKGNFDKLNRYLINVKKAVKIKDLERFGKEGVAALASATPVDTGMTAASWYYEITNQNGVATINFNNSNVNKHVNIAIILQYGHGTRNGGWVEGRDYINPAIRPVFDKIAKAAWKEVTKL
jgi:hypothetical protein